MLDTADCCITSVSLLTANHNINAAFDYAHLLPMAVMGRVVNSHHSKIIL